MFIRRLAKVRHGLTALAVVVAGLGGLIVAIAGPATPALADTVLCSGASYSTCTNVGYTDHGYGANSGNSYWRMDPGHNCTNYAAYVEQTVNGAPAPAYLLGNAYQWGPNASFHGVPVDGTPGKGSVAWWNQYAGLGSLGHVAYVESYTSTSITVSEDAAPGGPFDWRVIDKGSSRWPTGFIHFKDLPSSSTLWGVNTSGQAVRYAGSGVWTHQGGPTFQDIAASSSLVAGVSTTGGVYTYTGNNTWHQVSGATLEDAGIQ